jgi:hypothetical protein
LVVFVLILFCLLSIVICVVCFAVSVIGHLAVDSAH